MDARPPARILACLLAACGLAGAVVGAETAPMPFARLKGTVELDNERVLVQRFIVQPGESTGRRAHPTDELLVFIKGGVLTSNATGRATLWKDGRVVFHRASDPADDGDTNRGPAPIELVSVALKPVTAPAGGAAASAPPKYSYLNYPNIPGEDLLENDLVIVQRFLVPPGAWEGVHAHHPDMLYIHIKGGHWAARSKHSPPTPSPDITPDGAVGWMPTIDIGEQHQSGNVGATPIDLVWVTLKK
jgi:mannose-6-phosphate isomerase-like protein (cupin superfamily)